jgi:hypothetical protein
VSEDPGAPPERGIVVRLTADGYFVRVWPRPELPVARLAGAGAVTAGIGAALGMGFAPGQPWLIATITLGCLLFVGLLGAFAFGSGFMPVEVAVAGTTLNWDGERHAMAQVGDCAVVGRRVELRARDGRVLGAIDHVPPDVGRWLSLAIRASLEG